MGLWYSKDFGFELIAYSDADHAGCHDDCKSTSRGLQFLGDKLVSWSSKKQNCTAVSTAEAEYISLSACCAQVILMRTQLLDYGYCYTKVPMYCDSKSAISISCNLVQHSRTKHIYIRYHFIKEHVEQVIIMAQQQQSQIIPADQIVFTRYQSIRRCNNYVVLQNIPCSMKCKITGQILIDHALSYALTTTTDVPAEIDRETITHTVDMFCDTLQLPVETPNDPFIEPTDLKFIQRFLKIVGYEGIVDKGLDENYHSIKDDILLVSVYTMGNVIVRGMLIPNEFLTDDICATMKYKEYEKVFGRVDVPTIQPRPIESKQGTNRTPRATRRPTLMFGHCELHKKFYNSLGRVPNRCSVVRQHSRVVIVP
ncbi:hypothetical protein Tco_0304991 [Tanacetum coccineum]